MELEEAKKVLEDYGYIIEDTETHDEEYDEINDIIHSPKMNYTTQNQRNKLYSRRNELWTKNKHVYIKQKNAKLYNLKNELNDNGFNVELETNDYEPKLIVNLGVYGDVDIHYILKNDPDRGQASKSFEGYLIRIATPIGQYEKEAYFDNCDEIVGYLDNMMNDVDDAV